MKRLGVKSSAIRSIGYDLTTETMEVEYSSGTVYHYYSVPVTTYNEIMGAESIGKALNAVRGAFPFHALTLEETGELEQRDDTAFVEGDNAE